ncbi:MAG TPA: ribonuclease III [Bacillota bacterium]|nr:ribonuclease III [Bacillota bacterium]HOK68117.1 ribonuclease III [Bacillota bacterium]HPP84419.1 ribonuclease III [Bacillota bacterium]
MHENEQPAAIEELEQKIGYAFHNKELVKTALTHSSYSNEIKHKEKVTCNERLEFLGDSVLSLIVSDFIYKNYNHFNEGILTRVRANVVCENSLFELASEIELGKYLYLGHGELISEGRKRKSIIADAFEALLAAIYLDGGIEEARKFLLPRIKNPIEKAATGLNEDYKSLLQKIVQQTPEEILEYELVSEEGPPHDRYFTFNVKLNSNVLGTGRGRSKREAEQLAAREALILFGEIDENA